MPIKGITDRGERFPEIGQIRKGAAKVDGKIGKDLNYFRVTFDDAEQKSAQKFLQLYGPEPQAIKVMFCFNEIYRHWDANLEAYTAGRMIARSDGETYQFLFDTRTNKVVVNKGIPEKKYIEGEVLGTWHNNKKNTEEPIYCKYVGRLRLVIPELGRLNYLTAITYSRHDIENLSSQINALSIINHGIISGIPLILKRVPRMISCPNNDGTMARRLKWLLSLEADPEWVGPKFANMKALIFPEKTAGYLGTGEIIESNSPTAQEIETLPVDTTDDEDDEKSMSYEEVQATIEGETPPLEESDFQHEQKEEAPIVPSGFGVDVITEVAQKFNITWRQVNATLILCDLPKESYSAEVGAWFVIYKKCREEGLEPKDAGKFANDNYGKPTIAK